MHSIKLGLNENVDHFKALNTNIYWLLFVRETNTSIECSPRLAYACKTGAPLIYNSHRAYAFIQFSLE